MSSPDPKSYTFQNGSKIEIGDVDEADRIMSTQYDAYVNGGEPAPPTLHGRCSDALYLLILDDYPTGSRSICAPPPKGTDEDWIVLVAERDPFLNIAVEGGWSVSCTQEGKDYPLQFLSIQEPDGGDLNLIVTEEFEFFQRFKAATQVARRLNVLAKGDRVALFHAVLFGELCEDKAAEKAVQQESGQ